MDCKLLAAVALATAFSSLNAQDKVLRVVPHSNLNILDPIWTTQYMARNHGYMVYDTLFGTDEKSRVQPQMVDKWTVSPDQRLWSFTLRDGLQFHDGTPVTGEDVIASLSRWGKRDAMGTLAVDKLKVKLPAGGDRPEAVSEVSFEVERGEILCLVGESGSGKSVIAQAIMGLLPKTLPIAGGAVLLEGEDLTRASETRRRALRGARMSMIFQQPMTALNPVMSCGEQIDELLRFHTTSNSSERRGRAVDILREVALPAS